MHILKINTTDVCTYIYIYMHTHTHKCFISSQRLIKTRTQGTKIKQGVLTPTFSLIRKVLYHAELVTHSAMKTLAREKSILAEAIPSCTRAGTEDTGLAAGAPGDKARKHMDTRSKTQDVTFSMWGLQGIRAWPCVPEQAGCSPASAKGHVQEQLVWQSPLCVLSPGITHHPPAVLSLIHTLNDLW